MWPFKRSKDIEIIEVKSPYTKFDVTDQEIWNIIHDGFKWRGLKLIPNTASFGLERYNDGKYHLKGEFDKLPEAKIAIMIDNIELPKTAWNSMSDQEREDICKVSKVQLVYKANKVDTDLRNPTDNFELSQPEKEIKDILKE